MHGRQTSVRTGNTRVVHIHRHFCIRFQSLRSKSGALLATQGAANVTFTYVPGTPGQTASGSRVGPCPFFSALFISLVQVRGPRGSRSGVEKVLEAVLSQEIHFWSVCVQPWCLRSSGMCTLRCWHYLLGGWGGKREIRSFGKGRRQVKSGALPDFGTQGC